MIDEICRIVPNSLTTWRLMEGATHGSNKQKKIQKEEKLHTGESYKERDGIYSL